MEPYGIALPFPLRIHTNIVRNNAQHDLTIMVSTVARSTVCCFSKKIMLKLKHH
jgi:hypothetical protein